jgi:hypothetical protein
VVLAAPGAEPPAAYPVEDRWVPGPGGDVHALVVRPAGEPPYATGVPRARRTGVGRRRLLPRPPAAYVDAGYASCTSTTAAPPATAAPGATR